MESISAVQSNLSGTENIQADCVDDSNQISFEYKFKTKSDDDNIRQATGQVTERVRCENEMHLRNMLMTNSGY